MEGVKFPQNRKWLAFRKEQVVSKETIIAILVERKEELIMSQRATFSPSKGYKTSFRI